MADSFTQVWTGAYTPTEDGLEQAIGVNHFRYFLLTKLLLPMIRYSKTRVVTISSKLHELSTDGIHFNEFKYSPKDYEKKFNPL